MHIVLGVLIGIGLSASCGFRVFVPFLVMSIAAKAGFLTLSPGFVWVSSTPALIAFAVATVLEIAAYYVPVIDNILDSAAMPISFVAGAVVTASCAVEVHPFLKWTMAVIAGGGAALTISAATSFIRGVSTTVTGGSANAVINTGETVFSAVMSVLSIVMPVFALATLMVLVIVAVAIIKRRRSKNEKKCEESLIKL
ncbi:DUF4126 domain-containing protein [candidate division WOR-3 bacterium]|nr:DUF4126 domain-containing protein [candidate division WOR-3 bacterium]